MRSYIIILFLLSGTWLLRAQELHPAVLAVDGGSAMAGNLQIDWTLGELATASSTIGSRMFTEGFHQPYLQVVLGYDQPIHPQNDDESAQGQINLFPNPTAGEITLKLPPSGAEGYVLEIFDASGHPMMTIKRDVADTMTHLDVSDFAPGLYFVIVSVPSGNQRSMFKITKI